MRGLVSTSAVLLIGVFVALVALCPADAAVTRFDHVGLDGCCGVADCSSAVLGLAGFVVWPSIVAMGPALDRASRALPLLPLLPPPEPLRVSS